MDHQDAASEHIRGPLVMAARGLAITGGVLMVATAALVTVSTVMRWLTSYNISGDIEMVQIAIAIAAFTFLPLCQLRRGNVFVDTFTSKLSRTTQMRIDAFWDIVYGLVAAVMAWRLSLGAYDTITSHTVSLQLGLPIGYVIAGCAVMAAFLAIVAIAGAVRLMRSSG